MENKQLHPSVRQFKEFVQNKPALTAAVRRGEHTLQELYEDWYLLGEDDPRWDTFGKEKKSNGVNTKTEKTESEANSSPKGWIDTIIKKVKMMDAAQLEKMAGNLNGTLQTIQSLLGQFNTGTAEQAPVPAEHSESHHPFAFRKD